MDAVARAHGQPIQYLTADWASMIFQFKQQYGMNTHDAKLPAQSFFESFEERLHNGVTEAETLAHVVSLEEERVQIASKQELPPQMRMHLDSTLTLQTKKRYISRTPTDPESLRTKYRVMTNLWLLAQLRQPGRQLYADLTKDTFHDFLEELLSTDNFLMKRQIEGETWSAPVWTQCMDFEFQWRRDAMKLCREQRYSIQAAPKATFRDQEHRMKHWVTLLSIANSQSDRSEGISDKAAREIEQLKKQVAQLQKARSRSPRKAKGSGKCSRSYPALPDSRGQLALQDSSASSSNKGKAGRDHGEKEKSSSSKSKVQHTGPFAELFKKVGYKGLHKHNKTRPGFCFPFQSKSCTRQNCKQHHHCAGCDKAGVPYDDCLCLAHLWVDAATNGRRDSPPSNVVKHRGECLSYVAGFSQLSPRG